ncbi:Helicase conserved C-terminal domain [Ceratobasidium sp. AG-Ba]|nr:Helicase conserved C-terminal domain [Ceratobasidium sp. AG-Ba]
MGLTAIALNKEVHVETETWRDLAQGKYEIVLLSPEMALHSKDVHKVFDSDPFRKALMAIHVDEAHTISLWGGDFRKDYQGLGRIRARLPKGIPATLVSATLRPNVKRDAMSTLGFPSDPSKYVDINIGNERFNVPQTIIYIDDVNDVTFAVIALYDWLHASLRGQELIMPVHAWMTPKYRSEAMAKFASGEVRVIIAAEAAGMGCDISKIKRVIQFGICGSIDAFMQRIGRVWRGSDGKGEGWLIYEKWVPNCNSEKAPKNKGKAPAHNKRKAGGEAEAVVNAGKSKSGAKPERKCDRLLQAFVTESKCRREYLNRVYNNPTSRVPVPGEDCCDLCDPNAATRIPSCEFPTQRGPARAARRANAFPSAFGVSRMFGSSALISDAELERISRCAPVPSMDRLRSYLVKWLHVDSQLESMWEALKAGGFALPITSPDPVASDSSLAPHSESQLATTPPGRPTTSIASNSRSSAPTSKARSRTTKQNDLGRNHRISAGQVEKPLDEEAHRHTQSSKRPRLDSISTPRSSPVELSSASHGSAAFTSTPHIANSTFSAPARPVGRLIVPSQRPSSPVQRTQQFRTTRTDRRLPHRNAPIPLLHPLPALLPDFTYFGVPQTYNSTSPTLAPRRPSHPQPRSWYHFYDQRRMADELRILLS